MTNAQALGLKPGLRFAPPAHTPVRRHAAVAAAPVATASPATPPRPRRQTLLLVATAVAAHAALVWQWSQPAPTRPRAPVLQEIALLRPPPPVPLAPPPKPPPPVQQTRSPQPPSPALRTAPAVPAPVADALTVPENLAAAPTAAAPVVAAVPGPTPATTKVDEPITEPSATAAYLNNPAPTYPKAAQRMGLQGRVLLRVQVLANGQPGAVEIKQGSGLPVLDDAALKAVRGWTFVPARKGTQAVDGWTTVPIDFKLA